MKLNITCPKCGSGDVNIVENPKGIKPIYKCEKCGYERDLFPKFESDKDGGDK